jgi:RNA-directed DNA polymerase
MMQQQKFMAIANSSIKAGTKQHYATNQMSRVSATALLDQAKNYIYAQRCQDYANSDIWDLSLHWEKHRARIREELLTGTYQLSPVQVFGSRDGHRLTRWSAQDAVVLKALSWVLTADWTPHIDSRCHHVKGHGGLKGAVKEVAHAIKAGNPRLENGSSSEYHFVVKSDIADYYVSMHHATLLALCAKRVKDPRVLELLSQYMNRVEVHRGEHHLIDLGVAKGCPLSPLMGALMLKSLDKMIPLGCAYARFMDDWVILTRTRRQLRQVLKNMHAIVHRLKMRLALNKTFIGRISKGFDFLGYRFGSLGVIGLAQQTIDNHKQKLLRLDEQNASDQRVEKYVRNWLRWARSGLADELGTQWMR